MDGRGEVLMDGGRWGEDVQTRLKWTGTFRRTCIFRVTKGVVTVISLPTHAPSGEGISHYVRDID